MNLFFQNENKMMQVSLSRRKNRKIFLLMLCETNN